MSLSGSMDSSVFRAKARGSAMAVNHGLKAVVNTLRYFRLMDIARLHWVSIYWKRYFQPVIFRLIDKKQLYRVSINRKLCFQPVIFRLIDNKQLHWVSIYLKRYFQPVIFRLFDNKQRFRASMNWKLWFLRFLARIEIYSESLSYGKGSYLTTAFKPWLISMRC